MTRWPNALYSSIATQCEMCTQNFSGMISTARSILFRHMTMPHMPSFLVYVVRVRHSETRKMNAMRTHSVAKSRNIMMDSFAINYEVGRWYEFEFRIFFCRDIQALNENVRHHHFFLRQLDKLLGSRNGSIIKFYIIFPVFSIVFGWTSGVWCIHSHVHSFRCFFGWKTQLSLSHLNVIASYAVANIGEKNITAQLKIDNKMIGFDKTQKCTFVFFSSIISIPRLRNMRCNQLLSTTRTEMIHSH